MSEQGEQTPARGMFILIAGPSGAGKDTLIDAMRAARPNLAVVRRLITRAADAGGEDHEAVSPETFERLEAEGAMMLTWRAHGLGYGLPIDAEESLSRGRDVIANVSRAAVAPARARFAPILVLHVTAPLPVLAERLAQRGRETTEEIESRLLRAGAAKAPEGPDVVEIDNGGALEDAVAAAFAAIDQVKSGPAQPAPAPFTPATRTA